MGHTTCPVDPVSPILQMAAWATRGSRAPPSSEPNTQTPVLAWLVSHPWIDFCPKQLKSGLRVEAPNKVVERARCSLCLAGAQGFFSLSPAPPALTSVWRGSLPPPGRLFRRSLAVPHPLAPAAFELAWGQQSRTPSPSPWALPLPAPTVGLS